MRSLPAFGTQEAFPLRRPSAQEARPLRATFICEATVGHVAFAHRLRRVASARIGLDSSWIDISPDDANAPGMSGALERLPPFDRIWTARASLRARHALGTSSGPPDVLFFHTLAPALLSDRWLRRVPTVISVDATPINVDEVGAGYGHSASARPIEFVKKQLVRRAFDHASAIIAWSRWVERSLIDDYRVDPAKVFVQAPGVPTDEFEPGSGDHGDAVKFLFVGGDFGRKGGPELLDAFSTLPSHCELDIVTADAVHAPDRIRVHRGLGPGDPELLRLYGNADIFVLPTKADTWGHAVVEAMASGLPVITSAVGALPEIVGDGVEGLIVVPGDRHALTQAMLSLVEDPAQRARLGGGGRRRAVAEFDASVNLNNFVDAVVRAGGGDQT
ncbi:MAG: glycosyltransferase family 4 protein [Acidimicrobiales bacterium]